MGKKTRKKRGASRSADRQDRSAGTSRQATGKPGPQSGAGQRASGAGAAGEVGGRHIAIALIAVLALASTLRIWGIDWGLPQLYEEATPLRKAWGLWGWESNRSLDLNPHFFNYPSLVIYINFVVQSLVVAATSISGAATDAIGHQIHFTFHNAPYVIAGRLVTVLFSLGTVLCTYAILRRLVDRWLAVYGAFLVAILPYVVHEAHYITVDMPLAFFTALSLLLMLRVLDRADMRAYALLGVAIGLATSCKYTGAFLLVPAIVTHVFVVRSDRSKYLSSTLGWKELLAGGVVTALCFLVTSPFVLLDFKAFWEDLMFERQHMSLGHFGQGAATPIYYMKALANDMVGWLALVAAFIGTADGVIRRRPGVIIIATFVVSYFLIVTSWAMHADRYLLPAVAGVVVLTIVGIDAVLTWTRKRVVGTTAMNAITMAVLLAVTVQPVLRFPEQLAKLRPDTRTLAKKWVEANVEPGALIASEHYGPALVSARDLWAFDPEVRDRVLEMDPSPAVFAVQRIPLLSVKPDLANRFYDMSVYGVADYIITSSTVRNRYLASPERFPAQRAFYDHLDAALQLMAEFPPERATGPTIKIYRNPKHPVIFADRDDSTTTIVVEKGALDWSGKEAAFYLDLGVNYETFHHYEAARSAYVAGLEYRLTPDLYLDLVTRAFWSDVTMGNRDRAVAFMEVAIKHAPDDATRGVLQNSLNALRASQ